MAAFESPTTVKSTGVFVLRFCNSACFRFRSKSYTKHCKNDHLLSRNKTISSLLELIDHVLSISECFAKTVAFELDEKLTQSAA